MRKESQHQGPTPSQLVASDIDKARVISFPGSTSAQVRRIGRAKSSKIQLFLLVLKMKQYVCRKCENFREIRLKMKL